MFIIIKYLLRIACCFTFSDFPLPYLATLDMAGWKGRPHRRKKLLETNNPHLQSASGGFKFLKMKAFYTPNIARPKYVAASPNSSSIRSNWLYLAIRSEREAEPVLIWPVFSATARSAMKVSSVSPER